jgi:hypothetical protein
MRTAAAGLGALLIWGLAAVASDPAAADLEDRVAELEATIARAGTRNTSLHIYGQVNYALLSWDDGVASDTYVVDNETSSSRLGLIGQARIGNGTVAGYRIEMDFWGASSSEVHAGASDVAGDQAVRVRHANWFVEDASLGRLTVGQGSPATDDITIISLGAKMSDAALHLNNAFALGFVPGPIAPNPVFEFKWADFAHTVDSMRGNFVRYDTPIYKGFLLSAAAGENDIWDVALRYSDGPDWLRFAGGIGYMDNGELGIRDLKGSFSALHIPTGLFATVAGALRDDYGVTLDVPRDSYFYFVQLGLTKRYLPFGNTTVYAELGHYNDFGVGRVFDGMLNFQGAYRQWGLLDTKVDRWGIGIEQEVDAAGLLLYAQFHHYEGTFVGLRCADPSAAGSCGPEAQPVKGGLSSEPWQAVVVGARIQF